MTTVGYGDISAATLAERSMAILGMILANFVFSSIMGRMNSVIDKLSDKDKAKNDRMDEVMLFLRDSAMPKVLQMTLTSFYRRQDLKSYNFPKCALVSLHVPSCVSADGRRSELLWMLTVGLTAQVSVNTMVRKVDALHSECRLISVLPYRMRLTVILSVFKDVIESVPFLKAHADDAPFLIEVLSRCSRTRFSAASLLRMQQVAVDEDGEEETQSQACLYAAGTFDSDVFIVYRCAPCQCSWCRRDHPERVPTVATTALHTGLHHF